MKKIIATLLLSIIICLSGFFIYAKISSQETGNNYFNDNMRYNLARYPVLRNLIGMHFDGDAKYDYLGPASKKILIRVVPMDGLNISEKTAQSLVEKIQIATGKQTKFVNLLPVPYQASSSMEDLRLELLKNQYSASSNEAVLYIIVAGQSKDDHGQLGTTVMENGIAVFHRTLLDDMRNDTDAKIEDYEVQLLLHEFGHQIGLGHNTIEGCLMNEATEFSDMGRLLKMDEGFCDLEKKEIANMQI